MESRTESTPIPRAAALTALALLGPVFGVATQVWGQALLLAGLALLLILAPPRHPPGAVWCLLLLAILAIGLTAFLPGHWFRIPEWRQQLTGDFRVALPDTLSPQPWVSLHALCLLFAGLVFALYVASQSWGPHTRREVARWYTGGIAMLAALALAALAFGWKVPFWPKVLNAGNGFGFFPNRNQTGDVLGLAGIIATALAFDAFERRRKGAWFWTTSVVIIGAAIVQTYSRAGVLIFFGGIAAWVLLSLGLSTSRKGGALAVAGIALLLTGFFVFGGKTFERFQRMPEETRQDYRLVIQKDALHLAATAPWLGQGLGNFAPVFAMARQASADQNRAIHPESDWLWVAVEMGWPASVLFAVAFLLWLRECLPLSRGSDRALRSAAMVCGVAFAFHSFADVSGHRPGSAWPALFLAGLAMAPRRSIGTRRWIAPVFRLLGVLLGLIAAWWFASIYSENVGRAAPTLATVGRLSERIEQQNLQGEHTAAVLSADEALRIMPLSADLYYQRGVARVAGGFSVRDAAWDFGTARFLEPRWAELCNAEGKVWMEVGQEGLALDAWFEALRRAGKRGPEFYSQMLARAHDRSDMHAVLARLSRASPDYLLVFLSDAEPPECKQLISQLIEAEPGLNSFSRGQKQALFSIWFRRGDRSLLFSKLLENPDWRQDGWRMLAVLYAERKDFENACRIARESIPRPAMPKVVATKSLAELERTFRSRPDDFMIGLELHSAQLAAGNRQDALKTLEALQTTRDRPNYLAYIEAGLHEEQQEWEQAWNAWLRFGGKDFQ
jgi:O-antigen ligase/tetratricopeptide (TPR) repeat protein